MNSLRDLLYDVDRVLWLYKAVDDVNDIYIEKAKKKKKKKKQGTSEVKESLNSSDKTSARRGRGRWWWVYDREVASKLEGKPTQRGRFTEWVNGRLRWEPVPFHWITAEPRKGGKRSHLPAPGGVGDADFTKLKGEKRKKAEIEWLESLYRMPKKERILDFGGVKGKPGAYSAIKWKGEVIGYIDPVKGSDEEFIIRMKDKYKLGEEREQPVKGRWEAIRRVVHRMWDAKSEMNAEKDESRKTRKERAEDFAKERESDRSEKGLRIDWESSIQKASRGLVINSLIQECKNLMRLLKSGR